MSTKRRIINRGKPGRITPEIVDAWKRADFHALHMLLRLRPRNASPLPKEIAGPLGCSLDDLPIDLDDPNRDEALPRVVAIQQELLRIVGWPDCRHVYEENLADAEKWAAWCRKRFEHLPAGEYGTGTDLESRRQNMIEAEAEAAYCRELLAGLTRVQKKWARVGTL